MQFWMGIILGFIGSAVLWFFDPKWLRRKVGLEPKEPYFLKEVNLDNLKNDPVIGKIVPSPSEMKWAMEVQVPQFQQEGYVLLHTADGRECVFLQHDYRGPRRLLLMKKANA
jgi:hypothetical protein